MNKTAWLSTKALEQKFLNIFRHVLFDISLWYSRLA